jgi:hypothetical protein
MRANQFTSGEGADDEDNQNHRGGHSRRIPAGTMLLSRW